MKKGLQDIVYVILIMCAHTSLARLGNLKCKKIGNKLLFDIV